MNEKFLRDYFFGTMSTDEEFLQERVEPFDPDKFKEQVKLFHDQVGKMKENIEGEVGKSAKFVQIAAPTTETVFALDCEGRVWFNVIGAEEWEALTEKRDEG